jgi:hypothetical protein
MLLTSVVSRNWPAQRNKDERQTIHAETVNTVQVVYIITKSLCSSTKKLDQFLTSSNLQLSFLSRKRIISFLFYLLCIE